MTINTVTLESVTVSLNRTEIMKVNILSKLDCIQFNIYIYNCKSIRIIYNNLCKILKPSDIRTY